jgi:hypothetical protein
MERRIVAHSIDLDAVAVDSQVWTEGEIPEGITWGAELHGTHVSRIG